MTALDKLRALCDAATPGPWEIKYNPSNGVSDPAFYLALKGPKGRWMPAMSEEDCAFSSAARTALPALMELVVAYSAVITIMEKTGIFHVDDDGPNYGDMMKKLSGAIDKSWEKLEGSI